MVRLIYRAIQRYLRKHFPDERKRINAKAGQLLTELKRKAPDIGGRENSLSYNMDMFLQFIAYYEASDHRMSGEAIDEIIDDLYERMKFLRPFMNINNAVLLSIWRNYFYGSYQKYADTVKKKQEEGKWLDTWGMIVDHGDTGKGFAFTLLGCPIAEYAKRNGYEELMPHLCAIDHSYAKLMHARLIRTHTVASGDAFCDYRYVPDRERTYDEV